MDGRHEANESFIEVQEWARVGSGRRPACAGVADWIKMAIMVSGSIRTYSGSSIRILGSSLGRFPFPIHINSSRYLLFAISYDAFPTDVVYGTCCRTLLPQAHDFMSLFEPTSDPHSGQRKYSSRIKTS